MSTNQPATVVYCGRAFHYVDGMTSLEVEQYVAKVDGESALRNPFVVLGTQYGDTTLSVAAITCIRPATDQERREHEAGHNLGGRLKARPISEGATAGFVTRDAKGRVTGGGGTVGSLPRGGGRW